MGRTDIALPPSLILAGIQTWINSAGGYMPCICVSWGNIASV